MTFCSNFGKAYQNGRNFPTWWDYMTTGRIDEKGRILIPLELRQKLGLESGSEIVFMVSGKNIILRSALNSEEFRKLSKKITQEIQNSTNEPIEIEKLF